MSDDEYPPQPWEDPDGTDTDPRGRDDTALSRDDEEPTVASMLDRMALLTEQVAELKAQVAAIGKEKKAAKAKPAEWAWFPVPALSSHPPATLALWVEFYNATYVTTMSSNSTDNDHNRPIPECWLQHPGLAAEIATLAASWRVAFVGPDADATSAQNWHDRWRPGFTDRLHGWAPCSSDRHFTSREASPPREHRFTDDESASPS
jgi:uncharacterized small protein (DUF1192 family)